MSRSQRCLIVELDICKKEELYENNLGQNLAAVNQQLIKGRVAMLRLASFSSMIGPENTHHLLANQMQFKNKCYLVTCVFPRFK